MSSLRLFRQAGIYASLQPAPVATPAFLLGTTKPDSSNTGAGIIRPFPNGSGGTFTGTQTITSGTVTNKTFNGNVNLGAAQLLDCVIHGSVIPTSDQAVTENCLIDGSLTAPTGHMWLFDSTAATQGGQAQLLFSTVRGRVGSYFLNGVGKRNFYAYRCDISAVVDTFRGEPSAAGGTVNALVEGCYAHEMAYNRPDPTHSDNESHDDGFQFRGGTDGITIRGSTIHGNWSQTVYTGTLPTSASNLSALMFTPDVDQIVATLDRNWFDYGVDTINGGDVDLTSASRLTFTGNRFGRNYTRRAFNIKAAVTLTESGNVWEDTGAPIFATRP